MRLCRTEILRKEDVLEGRAARWYLLINFQDLLAVLTQHFDAVGGLMTSIQSQRYILAREPVANAATMYLTTNRLCGPTCSVTNQEIELGGLLKKSVHNHSVSRLVPWRLTLEHRRL